MNSTEAYSILELKPGSSKDEVKSAYRRLSLKYHPDKCKDSGAEELFKAINEAYRLLESYAPDERIRDVGEVRAKRAREAAGGDSIGWDAASKFNNETEEKPVGDIFGIFNFGEDLFGQIVDAAKNKSRNQK